MTFLLLADVSPLEDSALYDALYEGASLERRSVADSFRFRKDRNLSIGAAALLDIGLSIFGLREKDMTYGRNAYGKPYFLNAPEIRFNISHSGSMVAVAFSGREVGCDIEDVVDADIALAGRFFSRDEYEELLAEKDSDRRNRAFFRLWTMKESYMKAKGMGLSLPPESFSVNKIKDFSFLSPDIVEGYGCALCYSPDEGIPEVKFISSLLA